MRYYYSGVFVQHADGTAAPGQSFSLWDDPTGGTQITDVLAGDGVTPYGFTTDVDGNAPDFRGPDGTKVPLFLDTGLPGTKRYQLVSFSALVELVQQVAGLLVSGVGGTGGLPVGTTLDQIANGVDRLALTQAERLKLSLVADGATKTPIGVPDVTTGKAVAGTAKPGEWLPTPVQIGAPVNVAGFGRVWGRTAAQGLPTAAEGRQDGDYAFVDAT